MYYENPSLNSDEILVYLRKSRSDDPLLSVEEVLAKHETILKEWALHNLDSAIPEDNIYREVVSGETLADRPEILKVLKRMESPHIKAILTVEVQRLSRGDLEDAGKLMKLLRYTNTLVITPYKTYNLTDEYDRDIFERELKRGNEYLEYQKKIMKRGRLLSVSQGNYLSPIPPYGYDRTVIMDGKKKCPTLKINPQKAAVIRMIYDMYVNQDMGLKMICNYLNEHGIKSDTGGYWTAATLKDIIGNITYTGKVRWNRRGAVVSVEDSSITVTRPRAKDGKYLIYDGKHDAIISDELFQAAMDKQGRNHRAKADTKIRNPLAGILYCQCGKAMVYHPHKDRHGNDIPRLQCNNQKICNTRSCKYRDVVSMVEVILKNTIRDFDVQLNNDKNTYNFTEDLIRNLEARKKELERKEIRQWEKYSEDGMPKSVFDVLNEKVQKEKQEVESALSNAYDTVSATNDYEEKVQRFTDALSAFMDPDYSVERKNSLLKSCIDRITYRNNSGEIDLDVKLRL